MGHLAASPQGSTENLRNTRSEKNNVPASNARFIATNSQGSPDSRHEGGKSLSDSGTGQDKLPKEHCSSAVVGATGVPRLPVVPGEEPGACCGTN